MTTFSTKTNHNNNRHHNHNRNNNRNRHHGNNGDIVTIIVDAAVEIIKILISK